MEAKELRIGNYVTEVLILDELVELNNHGVAVREITADDLKAMSKKRKPKYPYMDVYPIRLTEEWLAELGFKLKEPSTGESFYQLVNDDIVLNIKNDMSAYNGLHRLRKLEYVHQLQNLYFALTGEELNYE